MRSPLRAAAVLAASALALALTSCGGEADPPPDAGPTPALWNPCDGVDPDRIGRVLGATVREETGTPTQPRCALVPVSEGDATLDATYLLLPGGLDEAFATMGRIEGAVTRPDVRGADDARLVVDASRRAVLVTGFVQNGDLVQTVNAADVRPYRRAAVVAAVRTVMSGLSRHADASGVE